MRLELSDDDAYAIWLCVLGRANQDNGGPWEGIADEVARQIGMQREPDDENPAADRGSPVLGGAVVVGFSMVAWVLFFWALYSLTH